MACSKLRKYYNRFAASKIEHALRRVHMKNAFRMALTQLNAFFLLVITYLLLAE
jgi:hypothetical protein